MNFAMARQVAEAWVRAVSDDEASIWPEKTQALPYGWVFFYNSKEFIADATNLSAALVGNVPILIERTNGELRVLGPRYEERLAQIEKELPAACMQAKPEQPRW
ncbi:hypothetical protein GJ699_03440 [Duganella sp. FT80W]|uniref:Immunity protein 35 domain-containing protein n=1 Tax=Duganella guangzhouensis TaxID=2666084 RepID=A0A6I2KUG2_9BURK|nr:YrhB domain-containing protein [Duganella guangzhouensis]MRW89030.1 hypothetical protein [Duganella guangzhouensis]